MNNAAIRQEACKQARSYAMENGIEIGKTISHPSDDFAYKLIDKIGNNAICTRPDPTRSGKKVIREAFPLDEIFDANVAFRIAMVIKGNIISASN